MTDDTTDEGNYGARSTGPVDFSHEIDEEESPSRAVVRAVATVTDTPVLDLEPLYDVLDPDHLDELFEERALEESSVSFAYGGCSVAVTPDEVRIRRECGDDD